MMFMCLKVSAVNYVIKNEEWKVDENDEDRMDVSYNGLQLHKTQFPQNRVMVTGIIMDNDLPSESNFVLINPAYRASNASKDEQSTSEKSSDSKSQKSEDNEEQVSKLDPNQLDLPMFEVEYGREPLEFLMSMLKSKFNLDVVPTNKIGMANSYGFSLKSSGSTYLGSQMSDYNKDANTVDSLNGPLLGTYLTTINGENPNMILQTKDEAVEEWANPGMDSIPALNIIYLLKVSSDAVTDNEEFNKYGMIQSFQENAKQFLEGAKQSDLGFAISRAILMENSLARTNKFPKLDDRLLRVLV
jgi:hypothetical protein